MYDVLILDGEQRSSLAAIRSLGQYGLNVAVASHLDRCLGLSSKYCSERIVTVDPATDPSRYIENLEKDIQRLGVRSVWPMTDITVALITKNLESIGPVPSQEQFERLSNKVSLVKLATEFGIPAPRSLYFDRADPARLNSLPIEFPVVIKPAWSRIESNAEFIATSVTYARTLEEAVMQFETLPWLQAHPFLIQEFVEGTGMGIFGLADNTGPYALFGHRRLREKPPSGGCSVLCESAALNEQMVEYTNALINEVGWRGAFMAEYKVTESGDPYLIEFNGRFWGSLQLAISSGMDYPRILYQRTCEGASFQNIDYRVGVRTRWLLGDLDSLYLKLKSRDYSVRQKIAEIMKFMLTFLRPTKYQVLSISDFRPFLTELRQYFRFSSRRPPAT